MTLTKTDFQLYRENPLHLWAKKHDQYVDATSVFDQHLIEQGYQVEELAIEYLRSTLVDDAHELITQQTYTDDAYEARVDALLHNTHDDTYDLYEIKSSTSDEASKEKNIFFDHLNDATFQALILEKNLNLTHVNLIQVNRAYIRQGRLDPSQLFLISSLDMQVHNLHTSVEELRVRALTVCQQESPDGIEACVAPKTCPCLPLCHPVLPEYSIYEISGIWGSVKKDLRRRGILLMKDIPDDYQLWDKQRKQVDVVKSGKPVIDKDAIRHQLEMLTMPLCFLDYETFNPGVPLYDGYHPYQHMIFQYSLHVVEHIDKEPKHFEYLVRNTEDPSRQICEHLIQDMPKNGTVISWNKSFEMGCNTRMAEMYPEYQAFLADVNDRMYDLGDPFKYNDMYVLPEFKGSWSIKNVLPVLVPELSYKALAIGEGATAMKSWWEMVHGIVSQNEKDVIYENLLKYCGLDTLAMVKIWEKLKELLLVS